MLPKGNAHGLSAMWQQRKGYGNLRVQGLQNDLLHYLAGRHYLAVAEERLCKRQQLP